MKKKDYRFIDKDPIVDLIRTVVDTWEFQRNNRRGRLRIIRKLAKEARLHPSTVDNILYGKTRRPQHYTVMQILRARSVVTRHYWDDGRELEVAHEVWRHFASKHASVTEAAA